MGKDLKIGDVLETWNFGKRTIEAFEDRGLLPERVAIFSDGSRMTIHDGDFLSDFVNATN